MANPILPGPSVIAENQPLIAEAAQFSLTVIITCWNYAEFVGRAIDSVISQQVPQCQIIVIDDGSTDDSWKVITDTGARAYRIENSGQRKACLFALNKTTSPFILFLDADDELRPGSIAKLLKALDKSVAKIQYPLLRIDSSGHEIGGAFPTLGDWREREHIQEQIYRNGVYTTPPTSGNVFRRDLCELLADADYDTAVDGIILFAAPFFGDIISLSHPLGLYRVHGQNDSSSFAPVDQKRIERNLNRYIDRIDHLNRVLLSRGIKKLVDCENALFTLQNRLFLNVVRGKRGNIRDVLAIARKTFSQDHAKAKASAISLFFFLLYALPAGSSKRLLQYRYR